jgi:hypothetical protein
VLPTSNKAITICPLNTGVRYAKRSFWSIGSDGSSAKLLTHKLSFTLEEDSHLTNMITMDKKRWNCTKKKTRWLCANTKGTFTFTRHDHYGTR